MAFIRGTVPFGTHKLSFALTQALQMKIRSIANLASLPRSPATKPSIALHAKWTALSLSRFARPSLFGVSPGGLDG
jgi:hypothetical protein